MSRLVYVNGRFEPYAQACVHVEDRGFQLGDGVYEVIEVMGGRLVDEERHIARLERSLRELSMPAPMTARALAVVMRETIRRNRLTSGSLYLQVTRGARPREFLFPAPGTVEPTVVCIARYAPADASDKRAESGISVISRPEARWARCDIKTVMLLPSVLAKEAAKAAGAKEAWFVDRDGRVTEGASSNAWIVTRDGKLKTRPADTAILRGVTRTTLLDVAARLGLAVVEEAFTIEEAKEAREAFVTSATNTVMPVVAIDGRPIGNGAPGSTARALRAAFHGVAAVSEA